VITRRAIGIIGNIRVGSGFDRAAISISDTVLGAPRAITEPTLILEVKASSKCLGYIFLIDLAQVNVLASQRDFKFISWLEFHLFSVGSSNQ